MMGVEIISVTAMVVTLAHLATLLTRSPNQSPLIMVSRPAILKTTSNVLPGWQSAPLNAPAQAICSPAWWTALLLNITRSALTASAARRPSMIWLDLKEDLAMKDFASVMENAGLASLAPMLKMI
jgi:hypothetical protein